MASLLTLILVVVAAAGGAAFALVRKKSQAPAETFEQMLQRTEGVTIAGLTGHDSAVDAPDPKKLYDAFVRGRNRVAKLYPQATSIQMSALTFFRTALMWNAGESFPRMANGPAAGAIADTAMGTFIYYAFEEAVEHETVHALMCIVDGAQKRTPAAIDNPKDADQAGNTNVWQIACHNTSDDPFGGGLSISVSGRAGCILPYSGPPKPAS